MKPKLYILAGANGSGKSTISKVLLPAEGIVYPVIVVECYRDGPREIFQELLFAKFKEDL